MTTLERQESPRLLGGFRHYPACPHERGWAATAGNAFSAPPVWDVIKKAVGAFIAAQLGCIARGLLHASFLPLPQVPHCRDYFPGYPAARDGCCRWKRAARPNGPCRKGVATPAAVLPEPLFHSAPSAPPRFSAGALLLPPSCSHFQPCWAKPGLCAHGEFRFAVTQTVACRLRLTPK